MAYLALGGSLLGFSAFIHLLRTVRPALATSHAYVNPVLALALGAAVAHERLTASTLVAAALVVVAVALVVSVRRPRLAE